ncbi:hypothetical protein FHS39_004980 [Streptomyces olivoverticillatus]|uniref:Uncharacterized protein n=1 Tax=Streptomyces olivoverticillatus TaxID=66427 RepID=A0A7W7LSY7_9ACTN|nr:hypothetical protein [Streptomyces olivoverticillatus]
MRRLALGRERTHPCGSTPHATREVGRGGPAGDGPRIGPRACTDALPGRHAGLRVAGPASPVLRGQGHGDTDPAARDRGAAPSGRQAQARLGGPSAAGRDGPRAAASPARAGDRLPAHPAGLAPAPGQEEVDAAAVTGTPTAGGRAARPDHPARRGEPPLGIPPRVRRAAPPRAPRQRPYAGCSAVPGSGRHRGTVPLAASGAHSSKPGAAGCWPRTSSTWTRSHSSASTRCSSWRYAYAPAGCTSWA